MEALVRFFVCVVLACACAGCMPRQLLMVTQYADENPYAGEISDVVQKRFAAKNLTCRIAVFNMNTIGRAMEGWRQEMGNLAVIRANAYKPEIIFVVGDEAARYYAQRFVDTPKRFIFLRLKADPANYRFTGAPNVAGVREEAPVREAFALMKELVPTAGTAAILADAGIEGDAVVEQIRATANLPLRVAAIKRASTLEEWMDAVRVLQDQVDVLCIASYSGVVVDPKTGATIPPDELLRKTAAVNRLPDFSFSKEAVRPDGVMAAVFVPVSAQAEIAGDMAVKVLFRRVDIGRIGTVTCTARDRAVSPQRAAALGVALPAPAPPAQGKTAVPAK